MIRTAHLAPLILLLATACDGDPMSASDRARVITPACAAPAPLRGTPDPRAPGYIVVFKDGTDVDRAVSELQRRHDIVVKHVYRSALLGFAADLGPAQVAAVRCEPTVLSVEHDGVVMLG